jgi:hypothetical protein
MTAEYKKRGGGYNTKGQDESQKHLDRWTKEEWQTKEGSGTARKGDGDGSRKRYLPKKAWEQMNDEEKEETEEKKVKGSKKGRQFVGNTAPAKSARKKAEGDKGRSTRSTRSTRSKTQSEKPVGGDHGLDAGDSAEELVKGDEDDQRNGQRVAGTKRRAKQSNASVKKQKDLQEAAKEDRQDDEEEYKEDEGEDGEDE